MFHFLATHMQDSLHGFHDSCKNHAKNLQVQWQDSWQVFLIGLKRKAMYEARIVHARAAKQACLENQSASSLTSTVEASRDSVEERVADMLS